MYLVIFLEDFFILNFFFFVNLRFFNELLIIVVLVNFFRE